MISVQAIQNLRPDAKWILREDDLEWLDKDQTEPTAEEITAEVTRLDNEAIANKYKGLRAAEYPPMPDYLDGIVKGDQAQIDKYIADCQAVKTKYPKGG
jgi:hypothetical protein